MAFTTKSPVRNMGACVNSGFPNTAEQRWTDGGEQTACIWSGALAPSLAGCPAGSVTSGGHTLLVTGPGRLHKIIPHGIITSGQPVTFYDAGQITVSGISVSGQRFIGIIPPRSRSTLALASGALDTVVSWQDVIKVDMPFTSGLCVAAASGAPGFSVSFTPETSGLGSSPGVQGVTG